jgi:acyl-coenzyme A synthetase/AMP-(fatty) acid ligase
VRDIDGVIDAVALVRDRGPNDRRLVCAYLTATGMEERTLRAGVSERLPAYMVPSRFRRFDRLPTTVNGKIDRKRVAELWGEPALLGTLKE